MNDQTQQPVFLELLPADERERLLADCTVVKMDFNSVLYQPPARVKHIYFPLSGFVSLVKTASDGSAIEVGIIGSEGLVGNQYNATDDTATVTALVQGKGEAHRMGIVAFRKHLARSTALQDIVQQHASYQLRQMAQTVLCTRFHLVEQRLGRWLLMTRMRARQSSFPVTHEFLSYMLGAQRSGVSIAMGRLRDRGLITFRRGEVNIVDHDGLLAAACSCHEVDIDAYRRKR